MSILATGEAVREHWPEHPDWSSLSSGSLRDSPLSTGHLTGGAGRRGGAVATTPDVRVRRVYDKADDQDGARVLVDHIWPRGVSKAKAALNDWCKDVSPSTALRRWYSHDPAKFEEFTRRYCAELKDPERAEALQHLRELATGHRLTLLTATKNPDISQAAVLRDLLRQ
jgi:uncharacterized protein YeaO (DUF488 family)